MISEALLLNIMLGMIGASAGGYLFVLRVGAPGNSLSYQRMFVAVIGAVVALVVYHAVFDGRALQ